VQLLLLLNSMYRRVWNGLITCVAAAEHHWKYINFRFSMYYKSKICLNEVTNRGIMGALFRYLKLVTSPHSL